MALLHDEGVLQLADLPSALANHHQRAEAGLHRLSSAVTAPEDLPAHTLSPRSPVISIPDSEKQAILAALEASNGERSKAAKLLKTSRTTLYRKMKEYGLSPNRVGG
jgi:two-component system response regulator HydG